MDAVENTHSSKKRRGIVFYGVKSKLLDYYCLGSKDPTGSSTLNDLGRFIYEHGIPRMIVTDHDRKLGAGKKWKQFIGKLFVPLNLSGLDKLNQNPV